MHYTPETLFGRQIVGCVNLGEKNIAGFTSQFLLVEFADESGAICLITVDPKELEKSGHTVIYELRVLSSLLFKKSISPSISFW